jgi:hypothetical protein
MPCWCKYRSAQRASKPIDRPGGDIINFTPDDGLQKFVEARPLVPAFGAADAGIFEDGDNVPIAALGHGPQLAQLVGGRLLGGADPDIERYSGLTFG